MATHSWHPPLPPGWEARWDPNQRAFFYINHSNKTTSWEDPRWTNKQKLATPAAGGQTSGRGEAIPMQNMSRASPQRSPAAHHSHSPRCSPAPQRGETTFTNQREVEAEAIVARLRSRFPDAGPVIKDVLSMCQNDEDEAASQLMQLGFECQETLPQSRSSSRASPAHNKGKQSAGASPHRSSSAAPKKSASPARQQMAPKPQISEAEKKKRQKKLCDEFKTLEPEVVKMALESCQYDENKTRTTLSRVANQWQSETSRDRGATSASSSSERARSQRTTSPVAFSAQGSLEPVVFSQDRPSPSRTTGSSVNVKTIVSGGTSVTGKRSATGKKTSTAPKPKQQQQQQRRAKHVTIITQSSDAGRSGAQRVVTSQPRPQPQATTGAPAVHSGGSGMARGPDHAQHLGPDPGYHIGADPVLRFGPNPELCAGPDPDLLMGGSMGADGPNPEFHHGNVPDLVIGSLGATGPNPSLRCAAEHPSPIRMGQAFLQTSI